MPNAMCFSRAIYHRTGISIDFQLDFNGLVGWSLNFKGVGKIVFFLELTKKRPPDGSEFVPFGPVEVRGQIPVATGAGECDFAS